MAGWLRPLFALLSARRHWPSSRGWPPRARPLCRRLTVRPICLPLGQLPERTRASGQAGGEVVVSASATARARQILRAAGARPISKHCPTLWRLRGNRAADALEHLQARGELLYAHLNGRALPAARTDAPLDPLAGTQCWMNSIGANRALAPPPGVRLTVIDTGVDASHPEFAARPTAYLNPQIIDHEHGTFVASIAAAPANGQGITGVYPQATLRSIDMGGFLCLDAIGALALALDTGPSVINMSWASTRAAAPRSTTR
jgi:hypothetical protein